MGVKFTSIKRHFQFIALILLIFPLIVIISFSFFYLRQESTNEQYLLHQNTLNFTLQELENNLFYSKISELSNLSIIRNELYRQFRILDLSVQDHNLHKILEQDANLIGLSTLLDKAPKTFSLDSYIKHNQGVLNQNDYYPPLTQDQAPINNSAQDNNIYNTITSGTRHLLNTQEFKDKNSKLALSDEINAINQELNPTDFAVLSAHLKQLQNLGFIAFSVNTHDEKRNIFINPEYQKALDLLTNHKRNLRSYIYEYSIPNTGNFVVLQSPIELKNELNQTVENAPDRSISSLNKSHQQLEDEADILLKNLTQSNQVAQEQNNDSVNLYLGIIARLSYAPNQAIVIITNISKLKHQDVVLRKLIANSLDELVISVGLTAPVSITLIDDQFNPLAGNLSKSEVKNLINSSILKLTNEQGMFQGFNKQQNNFVTTGYFKPYNWYILINSNSDRAHANVWQFVLILFILGVLSLFITFIILYKYISKAADDVNIISNRVRQISNLLLDPIMINRICDNMPKRNDEIGALGSYVRLMSKSMYQSIQEINHNKYALAQKEDQDQVISTINKISIIPELFIREYYNKRIMVHSRTMDDNISDFYDVIELNKHKIALIIGSSNVKGVTGAAIRSINVNLFRQMIKLTESIKLPLPKAIMELNQNIFENNPKSIYCSLCVIIIDEHEGRVEYLNAGHNLPLIYTPNAGFEYIDVRNGPIIGKEGGAVYTSISFDLSDNSSLLFYTDGLLDCTNNYNEPLGQDGLENLLHDAPLNNAADTIKNLEDKIKAYTKDSEVKKSYTLACYHYKEKEHKKISLGKKKDK